MHSKIRPGSGLRVAYSIAAMFRITRLIAIVLVGVLSLIHPYSAATAIAASDKPTKLEKIIAKPETLVARLAKNKMDPNAVDIDGVPILIKAIQLAQPNSFRALLDAGALPEAVAPDGSTAWYHALVDPSAGYLETLLQVSSKQPVIGGDRNALRAVDVLVARGTLKTHVSILLSARDFSVNARDSSGKTILEKAILGRDDAAADSALAAGATATGLSFEVLANLVTAGNPQTLLSVLAAGADPDARNPDGKSILYAAIEAENAIAASALLEKGAKPANDIPGFDSLTLAIVKGLTGTALALLEHGAIADRLSGGIGPVDAAQLVMDAKVLAALDARPPNPAPEVTRKVRIGLSEIGFIASALQAPWDSTLTQTVKRYQGKVGLPAHGHPSQALLRTIESQLQAPFLKAAASGDSGQVARLRQEFPDLDAASDANGWDALMHAAYSGQVQVVEQLLAAGASTKAVDSRGSSAFLLGVISPISTEQQKRLIASAFVRVGADPKLANKDGASPVRLGQASGGWLAESLRVQPVTASATPILGIFGRPVSSGNSYWCDSEWNAKSVKENWDKKLNITDLASSRYGLCVVMGRSSVPYASSESYVRLKTLSELLAAFDEQEGKKRSLVDVAQIEGEYIALFVAASHGSMDGWFQSSLDEFGDKVKSEIWDKGFKISNVVAVGNRLLVTFGNSRGFTGQAWTKGSLEHVLAQVKMEWKKGRYLTNLVNVGGIWLVILSSGADIKDQVILAAGDWSEFRTKVDAKWKEGWRLQSIVDTAL